MVTEIIEHEILPIVSKAAPLLGSVLGGPFASTAIALIAQVFGVNSTDLNRLAGALTSSPDTAVKLKQLETDHADTLAKLAEQHFETATLDKQDARKLAELEDASYKRFLKFMAVLVTIGFFSVLFAVFLPLPISSEEKNLLSLLVGMLASKWQTIIDFFFGSST